MTPTIIKVITLIAICGGFLLITALYTRLAIALKNAEGLINHLMGCLASIDDILIGENVVSRIEALEQTIKSLGHNTEKPKHHQTTPTKHFNQKERKK